MCAKMEKDSKRILNLIIDRTRGRLRQLKTYNMCIKYPPKVFVARVLVETCSAAGQDIVLFWLHIFLANRDGASSIINVVGVRYVVPNS